MAGVRRLIQTVWVLARHDALLPREVAPLAPAAARWPAALLRLFAGPEARRGRPGERLARALERLGPVTIKMGQVLSTRADVFGTEFTEDLGRLRDRLDPFPQDQAEAEVARSLGRPLTAVFEEFGPAVAAASLAQAHAARLVGGRRVAVKVLRPGIERRVAADVAALSRIAALAERWVRPSRRLEPRAFVATVARALELELDLRLEAAAASELGEIMSKTAFMSAPTVEWSGVGRRVLTLDWAEGMPMSDPAALVQPGLDRTATADKLIRAFLTQALDEGTFHADLHEGNLFCSAPDRLVAVDFGIVGRLGRAERRYLAEILWGFITRDYARIAQVHFDAGYVPPRHSVEAFAQALRAVGEPVVGRPASEVSMGRLLTQLFEITELFDMNLRPELVLLQKTMVTVEGVARRLDPHHDLWAAARPVVEAWIRRELGPAAQMRDLLQEIRDAVRGFARLAEPPVPVVMTPAREGVGGSVALGLSLAAFGLAVAALAVAVLF